MGESIEYWYQSSSCEQPGKMYGQIPFIIPIGACGKMEESPNQQLEASHELYDTLNARGVMVGLTYEQLKNLSATIEAVDFAARTARKRPYKLPPISTF
jgi:hypothetical protein